MHSLVSATSPESQHAIHAIWPKLARRPILQNVYQFGWICWLGAAGRPSTESGSISFVPTSTCSSRATTTQGQVICEGQGDTKLATIAVRFNPFIQAQLGVFLNPVRLLKISRSSVDHINRRKSSPQLYYLGLPAIFPPIWKQNSCWKSLRNRGKLQLTTLITKMFFFLLSHGSEVLMAS